jgi:AraC-like DNA-binding protein
VEPSQGYREWAPPIALRDALVCLWHRTTSPVAEPVIVLPDACSDIIWEAGRGAFVAGPDTQSWRASLTPGAMMLGARLAPGAGGPALRIALEEIRNQRVHLADLAPSAGAALDGELSPRTALDRLIGTAFALTQEGPPDAAVRAASRMLAQPQARLAEVTHRLGLSERQLRRRCLIAAGYGPKTLQRVLRFQRFVAAVRGDGAPRLARLAYDSGYADQAHLTRECKQLSAMTPTALAAQQRGR